MRTKGDHMSSPGQVSQLYENKRWSRELNMTSLHRLITPICATLGPITFPSRGMHDPKHLGRDVAGRMGFDVPFLHWNWSAPHEGQARWQQSMRPRCLHCARWLRFDSVVSHPLGGPAKYGYGMPIWHERLWGRVQRRRLTPAMAEKCRKIQQLYYALLWAYEGVITRSNISSASLSVYLFFPVEIVPFWLLPSR